MKNWQKLIIAFVATFAAAAAGSLATFSQIPTWYASLHRSMLNPPNWVFGPVWTVLYILMAIALFIFWQKAKKEDARHGLILFGEQLVLNALWSVVFFGQHQILLALVNIIVLWLAIIATTICFYRTSKLAAYLMIPYFLWVTFASILNYSVWLVNK